VTTTICKGVVRNNVVVPENGAHLPEGAVVEVRFVQPEPDWDAAFERVFQHQIEYVVGMAEIIEEEKREREERHVP
jgi:hypothetical protein